MHPSLSSGKFTGVNLLHLYHVLAVQPVLSAFRLSLCIFVFTLQRFHLASINTIVGLNNSASPSTVPT